MLSSASSSVSLKIQFFWRTSKIWLVSDISFGGIERSFVSNNKACKLSCALPILKVFMRVLRIAIPLFAFPGFASFACLVNSWTSACWCVIDAFLFSSAVDVYLPSGDTIRLPMDAQEPIILSGAHPPGSSAQPMAWERFVRGGGDRDDKGLRRQSLHLQTTNRNSNNIQQQ